MILHMLGPRISWIRKIKGGGVTIWYQILLHILGPMRVVGLLYDIKYACTCWVSEIPGYGRWEQVGSLYDIKYSCTCWVPQIPWYEIILYMLGLRDSWVWEVRGGGITICYQILLHMLSPRISWTWKIRGGEVIIWHQKLLHMFGPRLLYLQGDQMVTDSGFKLRKKKYYLLRQGEPGTSQYNVKYSWKYWVTEIPFFQCLFGNDLTYLI